MGIAPEWAEADYQKGDPPSEVGREQPVGEHPE